MLFDNDDRYMRRREVNRRLSDAKGSILMVTARVSEQKKKRMHRLGAIILILVVTAGTVFAAVQGAQIVFDKLFAENDRFLIENIDVRSDGRMRVEHVRDYAHVAEGMNLFAVDLEDVRNSLEVVPLVNSVEVRRRLPDTLEVRIRERIGVARLGDESTGYPLSMDREGVVLGPGSVSQSQPYISGFRKAGLRPGVIVDDAVVRSALEFIELCDAPQHSRFIKIARVDVASPEYMDVRLVQGERVLMPRADMAAKLTTLCEIIKRAADNGQAIAAVDMTVDRNFPVKFR